MTPEQRARLNIDQQLVQSGWIVQSRSDLDITAGLGVAIREFPLKRGFVDYLLYADVRAIGVVEAKPEGHTLTGVETQSSKYVEGLPDGLPNYRCRFLSHTSPPARLRSSRTRSNSTPAAVQFSRSIGPKN